MRRRGARRRADPACPAAHRYGVCRQSSVRHRQRRRRLCQRHPGPPRQRTADQGRGQPRASRQPGRHQRDRPGRDPRVLRPGPQPRSDPRRRTAGVVLAADGAGGPARGDEPVARRGVPHPDGHHDLTHARAPDRCAEAALPEHAVASVGAGVARCGPRRRDARLWPAGRPGAETRCRRSAADDRQRPVRRRARPPAIRPRFCRKAQPGADRPDEPGVRDRADADVDRGGGGSSLHRRAARSGADRAGTGRLGAGRTSIRPTCPAGSRRWLPT